MPLQILSLVVIAYCDNSHIATYIYPILYRMNVLNSQIEHARQQSCGNIYRGVVRILGEDLNANSLVQRHFFSCVEKNCIHSAGQHRIGTINTSLQGDSGSRMTMKKWPIFESPKPLCANLSSLVNSPNIDLSCCDYEEQWEN